MVIFLYVLALFFLFFPFDVPSSCVSILVKVLVTLSLTCAFLIGITSGSFPFSSCLVSKWITLTTLSPISLGNGGIAATASGGRSKICGRLIGGGCG